MTSTEIAMVSRIATSALGPPGAVSIEPIRAGMSGASLYRCTAADGRAYAVKRWPQPTTAARLAEVHRVMRTARENGCEFVPAVYGPGGSTVIEDRGAVWEVAQWVPGDPLPGLASAAEIAAGSAAVGRFHQAVQTLGSPIQPPPAVLVRLQRLAELAKPLADLQGLAPWRRWSDVSSEPSEETDADRLALTESIGRARRLLLAHWESVTVRIRRDLEPYCHLPLPAQYVLRDIHREHLLMLHRQVTGMIDFDAVRFDTPAADLARWATGFLTDPALTTDPDRRVFDRRQREVWSAALAGIRDVSPFSSEEERLARRLLFASVWISLANWLVWLVIDRRRFAVGLRGVATRIDELVRLTQSLGPASRDGGDPWGGG